MCRTIPLVHKVWLMSINIEEIAYFKWLPTFLFVFLSGFPISCSWEKITFFTGNNQFSYVCNLNG